MIGRRMGGIPRGARGGIGWGFLVGGALASVAHVLLPGFVHDVGFAAVGLAAALAILFGVRAHTPPRSFPWIVLAAGLLVVITGGLIAHSDDHDAADVFPSVAGGVALAGHVIVAIALLLLLRAHRRDGGWRSGCDATLVAASGGLATWVFLVRPATVDLTVPLPAYLTTVALPLLDVFMLAILAHEALGQVRPTPALSLLIGGFGALLVADVAWLRVALESASEPGYVSDAGWLLAAVACGAAVLHPSMPRVIVADPAADLTSRCLVVMAATSAVTPTALAIQWWRGEVVDVALVAGCAAAISVLVAARLISTAHRRAVRAADSQVRLGEQRFRAVVQHTTDLIVTLDADGIITYASPAVELVLGYPSEALLGQRLIDLAEPSEGERLWWFFAKILAMPGQHASQELRLRHQDGTPRLLAATATNMLAAPEIGGIILNARDVSSRPLGDERDSRYRALIEQIPVITYIGALDPQNLRDWTLQHVSPQLETLLGYSVEEYLGDPKLWRNALHPEDADRILADEARAIRTGEPLRAEYRLLAADGHTVWVRDEAVLVRDAAGTPLYWHGVLSDITERKQFEDALTHQAFHDPLTGLPNRALFLDRLARALEAARRDGRGVAVLFLDLDGFKLINDNLGHDAGDRALVLVARRLEACRRPGDTLARFGGDEFAMLLEELPDPHAAVAVTERIADALRDPLAFADQEVYTTASVGIAVSNAGQEDPGDLLRDADAAMYEAKQTQAGYTVFDNRMSEYARMRLRLEADLRRALADDELQLVYQPVVDLATGQIVEVEALVRWEHPELGLLLPPMFVPLAEETGLIEPLGRWVLGTACRQAVAWDEGGLAGPPLVVSINLSARQLASPTLVHDIAQALDTNLLPAARLKLEMSESVALSEEGTPTVLPALKALGVQLALDNFGTGYSSLSVLKQFPFDDLKLDRTYVAALGRQSRDTNLVTAVLAFASALELRVTAEGVETAAQVATLRTLGCGRAQGFYFARPQTAEAIALLLAAHPDFAAPTPIRMTS